MNPEESERFETELRRLKPARLPDHLMERMTGSRPDETSWPTDRCPGEPPGRSRRGWWPRPWLVPFAVAAGAVLTWGLWRTLAPETPNSIVSPVPQNRPGLVRNDLELDQQEIAAYDAVVLLPGGEPVRFQCREWIDQVVFRDPDLGVVIERRTPRFEAIPVSYETY